MVELDLPPGWQRRSGSVNHHYFLGTNDNGVTVGYQLHGPGSAAVWAGKDWHDKRTVANVDGENEAKLRALEFMRKYPDVTFESGRGTGTLKDADGRRVTGV